MYKRKLRNNFNKLKEKVAAVKRAEHIHKRLNWFGQTRASATLNDCLQSWRLFVKRHKLAKKFLMRSSNALDKQLVNEAFSVWKQMCSTKRQQVYLDNIQELNRRKEEHEE